MQPNEYGNELMVGALREIASSARHGWQRIFVNFEAKRGSAGGIVSDVQSFSIHRSILGRVTRHELQLSSDAICILSDIGEQLMDEAGLQGVTIDVILDVQGKFRAHVDYGPPERLGGDWNALSRHLRYASDDPLIAALVQS